MEVHAICHRKSPADPFREQVVSLIDNVGRPSFPRYLFRLIHDATECEHISAFAFAGRQPPRVVLAENTGEPRLASSVAQKYIARYWRLDPANRVLDTTGPHGSIWGLRIAASDITDAIYRGHCYTAVGLGHRLSLSQFGNGQNFRLNVYCQRAKPFSESIAHKIFDAADLLMALVRRHDTEQNGAGPPLPVSTFQQRLRDAAPKLSKRELEVTSLIAKGLSSQGIALELGVSINTVLTYRKRAYTRLNISTQNELMRLLLGAQSKAGRLAADPGCPQRL
ncbi:MAG: LuxR C-terminal-related transcriptional regulator [Pseudolabrys sp.]|nr:LuxR C-terminal-related transcriptional regulator [Pseudolabrys sp.]